MVKGLQMHVSIVISVSSVSLSPTYSPRDTTRHNLQFFRHIQGTLTILNKFPKLYIIRRFGFFCSDQLPLQLTLRWQFYLKPTAEQERPQSRTSNNSSLLSCITYNGPNVNTKHNRLMTPLQNQSLQSAESLNTTMGSTVRNLILLAKWAPQKETEHQILQSKAIPE